MTVPYQILVWAGLAMGAFSVARSFWIRRGPMLTHPLEQEILFLQTARETDLLKIVELEGRIVKLEHSDKAKSTQIEFDKGIIMLLRTQIENLGDTPAYRWTPIDPNKVTDD